MAIIQTPVFDLQGHSTQSDGELAPAEVVRAAKQAGVELFALTDHDSVEGLREAADAADDVGLALVPAVEVSVLDPVAADLHVCGYLVDPADPGLLVQLKRSREDREKRAERMIEALEQNGWAVDQEFLDKRVAAGLTVGRPHLAEAVASDARNAARLEHEQLNNPTEFLVAYLIEGKPAFRDREAPSVSEAIDLIHGAGGVAVWAHPFWDVEAEAEVLATLERFAAAASTESRRSTSPTRRRRPTYWSGQQMSLGSSQPAHRTTTDRATGSSTASAHSRRTATSPTSGHCSPERQS